MHCSPIIHSANVQAGVSVIRSNDSKHKFATIIFSIDVQKYNQTYQCKQRGTLHIRHNRTELSQRTDMHIHDLCWSKPPWKTYDEIRFIGRETWEIQYSMYLFIHPSLPLPTSLSCWNAFIGCSPKRLTLAPVSNLLVDYRPAAYICVGSGIFRWRDTQAGSMGILFAHIRNSQAAAPTVIH